MPPEIALLHRIIDSVTHPAVPLKLSCGFFGAQKHCGVVGALDLPHSEHTQPIGAMP